MVDANLQDLSPDNLFSIATDCFRLSQDDIAKRYLGLVICNNNDEKSWFERVRQTLEEHGHRSGRETDHQGKNVAYEIDCPKKLFWYIDRNLMTGVMSNTINNAQRKKDVFTYPQNVEEKACS